MCVCVCVCENLLKFQARLTPAFCLAGVGLKAFNIRGPVCLSRTICIQINACVYTCMCVCVCMCMSRRQHCRIRAVITTRHADAAMLVSLVPPWF